MYIIGIDPSSKKLAMVSTRAHKVHVSTAMISRTSSAPYEPANCGRAQDAVRLHLEETVQGYRGPRVGFVEKPVLAGARNIQSTIKQSYINGAVCAELCDWGFEVVLVEPSRWKKDYLGKGGATKEEISSGLATYWPEAKEAIAKYTGGKPDQDLDDAGCICGYGYNERVVLPRGGKA